MMDRISHMQHWPAPIRHAQRVVIKVGSSLLLRHGRLRRRWLAELAGDIIRLREAYKTVVIVTSGAVGLGRSDMGRAPDGLAQRQAAAALGQVRLAEAWRRAFAARGIAAAQVLLTPDDTEDRRRHLNARATMEALLSAGAIPVINENDTVATDELKFGDNDRLAARVGQLVSADAVILLSDVDGLYDADPNRVAGARHIPAVDQITDAILAMAGGASSPLGTGGMASKLEAARIALAAGAHLAITDGRPTGALGAFLGGARATWFMPATAPLTARKAWIAATLAPRGWLDIDAGAARAIMAGRSLLAAGVTGVSGAFDKGDPVAVRRPDGSALGTGLVNYGADEARALAGQRSDAFARILGYPGPRELIHRDNFAVRTDGPATQESESAC